MRKIGITGGIASGKTTASLLLEKHGAYRINADDVVHEFLKTDPGCIRSVISLLGTGILKDGKIDRKAIASLVFSNPDKLNQLEAILHPPFFERIEEEYQRIKHDKRYNCFVVEVPLVYEIGREGEFDLILVVLSDEEEAKNRFISAGFSIEEYARRMKRQWDVKKKAARADFLLSNTGDLFYLEKQIKEFIYTLIRSKPVHEQREPSRDKTP